MRSARPVGAASSQVAGHGQPGTIGLTLAGTACWRRFPRSYLEIRVKLFSEVHGSVKREKRALESGWTSSSKGAPGTAGLGTRGDIHPGLLSSPPV
jgi:hypothetical protein